MTAVRDILAYLSAEGIPFQYRGIENAAVSGFSSLTQYRAGTMTWIRVPEKCKEGPAPERIALLVAQSGIEVPGAPCVITSPESKRAFFSVVRHFYGSGAPARPSCGAGSYVSPKVRLGRNVTIGCGCVLDGDISIGDHTVIWHHVTILNRVEIGADCVIHSGAVIGHDGYAFYEAEGHKEMVAHYGGVVIGDGVWIGANTNIARGVIDDTRIGDGCKVDALCHIAHNVVMERDCALVAGSIIMGSAHLQPRAYVASAAVRDQTVIGRGALIGMGAAVVKNVPDETTVAGVPAKPFRKLEV